MKSVFTVIITIVFLCIFSACEGDKMTLKHYVMEYVLDVSDDSSNALVVEDAFEEGMIRVMMRASVSNSIVSWKDTDDTKRSKYMSLARKNNDLGWDEKTLKYGETHLKATWFRFTANQVIGITVTAESNWDEQTPKGSSLDDKFIFISTSPDQFLKNGYKLDRNQIEEAIKNANPKVQSTLKFCASETLYTALPICDILSDIKFEDYQLMGVGQTWFALKSIDKLTKGAKINIQIKFGNGEIVNYKHICQENH